MLLVELLINSSSKYQHRLMRVKLFDLTEIHLHSNPKIGLKEE